MTITNQGTPRRGRNSPTAPATRLPSARERRPALAALAVLLIAGGAVLAGWLALRQSQTESYLYIADPVDKGERITGQALGSTDLPAEGVPYILESDAAEVVGQYAQVDLVPGTVLTRSMLGQEPELGQGRSLIGLALEPGFVVDDVSPGDPVTLVLINPNGNTHRPEQVTSGVVRDVEKSDSGSALVSVEVLRECAPDFTVGAANGDVALAMDAPQDEGVERCSGAPARSSDETPSN
jgi:hypothetical protein